jgi:hypothetical protein
MENSPTSPCPLRPAGAERVLKSALFSLSAHLGGEGWGEVGRRDPRAAEKRNLLMLSPSKHEVRTMFVPSSTVAPDLIRGPVARMRAKTSQPLDAFFAGLPAGTGPRIKSGVTTALVGAA